MQEEAPKELSLQPGVEDDGGNMQVEMEQREHDVRLAPELVGQEAEETRAALGELATVPGNFHKLKRLLKGYLTRFKVDLQR